MANVSIEDYWENYPPFCDFPYPEPPNDGRIYCPAKKDMFFCWNYTLAGTVAHQHCPNRPNFVHSKLAYKECTTNGTWFVHPILRKEWIHLKECIPTLDFHFYVYLVGYSLSIVALIISLIIFIVLKRIRCDRVQLHKNLFVCHLLNSATSIAFFVVNGVATAPLPICNTIFLVSTFFGSATYFWMFVEGLYLLAVLVLTFQAGKKLLIACTCIGWGVPLLLTIIFAVVRHAVDKSDKCGLQPGSRIVFILLVPILLSILANVCFMVFILNMLLKKMRDQRMNNRDTQNWWKASKAILILTPVLGAYYLLVLIQPDEHKLFLKIHEYVSAVTVSFQGLLVTMPFCFFNREVHEAIQLRCRQSEHRQTRRRSRVPLPRNQPSSLSLSLLKQSLPQTLNDQQDSEFYIQNKNIDT